MCYYCSLDGTHLYINSNFMCIVLIKHNSQSVSLYKKQQGGALE